MERSTAQQQNNHFTATTVKVVKNFHFKCGRRKMAKREKRHQ